MVSDESKSHSSFSLMAWLRLMRLPTVFTALSNILCGYFVSSSQRDVFQLLQQPDLWLLLVSSCGLYLGGMVLNDVFDAALDAKERPSRPIPAGQISRVSGTVFGTGLLLVGLIAAWRVGAEALVIASCLVVAIVLYDGLLKNTWLAPTGMATCRFLNVMLGAAASGTWAEIAASPALPIAVALGGYILGVTFFAQNEAGTSSRTSLVVGLLLALSGLSINAFHGWRLLPASTPAQGAFLALALIAANITFRSVRAIQANQPVLLQKAVGFMLLNIIFIDATMTFCFTGSGQLAAVIVILVIPATLMKRVIPMS